MGTSPKCLLNYIPEGEAEEAVPGEDVDDAADEGEDDLPRLRHPRRRLDKVGVPGQAHL